MRDLTAALEAAKTITRRAPYLAVTDEPGAQQSLYGALDEITAAAAHLPAEAVAEALYAADRTERDNPLWPQFAARLQRLLDVAPAAPASATGPLTIVALVLSGLLALTTALSGLSMLGDGFDSRDFSGYYGRYTAGWPLVASGLAALALAAGYVLAAIRLRRDDIGLWAAAALAAVALPSMFLGHGLASLSLVSLLLAALDVALLAVLLVDLLGGGGSKPPREVPAILTVVFAVMAGLSGLGSLFLGPDSAVQFLLGALLIGLASAALVLSLKQTALPVPVLAAVVGLGGVVAVVAGRNVPGIAAFGFAVTAVLALFLSEGPEPVSPPLAGFAPAVAAPTTFVPAPPPPTTFLAPEVVSAAPAAPAFVPPPLLAPAPPAPAPPAPAPPAPPPPVKSTPAPAVQVPSIPAAAALVLRAQGRADIPVARPVVLGRAPEHASAATEVLPDPTRSLSRSHVLVEPAPDGTHLLVQDLGSTNGTWVLQGEATSRKLRSGETAPLHPGGTLLLGGDVTVDLLDSARSLP